VCIPVVFLTPRYRCEGFQILLLSSKKKPVPLLSVSFLGGQEGRKKEGRKGGREGGREGGRDMEPRALLRLGEHATISCFHS
jgi:hypothetical protein